MSVLEGARETLSRDRPNLFVENEFSHAGDGVQDVFDMMKSLDYDGFALIDGVLRNTNQFLVADHQINARRGEVGNYVKNFIFIPR